MQIKLIILFQSSTNINCHTYNFSVVFLFLRRLQQLIQYRSDLSSSSRSSLYYTYGSGNYSDTYSSIRSTRHSSETTDSIRPLPHIPRARFYRRGLEDRYSDMSSEVSLSDMRNILSDNFTFASDAADSDGNVQYRWDFDVDRSDTRSYKIRRPRIMLDSPYTDSSVSTTSVS